MNKSFYIFTYVFFQNKNISPFIIEQFYYKDNNYKFELWIPAYCWASMRYCLFGEVLWIIGKPS